MEQARRRARSRGTGDAPLWSPPQVGAVYMANTLVFSNGDHAEHRPVVVVRAPLRPLDYLVFLQRTSTCFHLAGVDHPRDPALGLERPGKWVFAYQRSVRADEFESHRFEPRGALDPEYLARLVAEWEQQP